MHLSHLDVQGMTKTPMKSGIGVGLWEWESYPNSTGYYGWRRRSSAIAVIGNRDPESEWRFIELVNEREWRGRYVHFFWYLQICEVPKASWEAVDVFTKYDLSNSSAQIKKAWQNEYNQALAALEFLSALDVNQRIKAEDYMTWYGDPNHRGSIEHGYGF